MSRFTLWSAGLALFLFTAQVHAALVDFNDQPRGKIITSQFFAKYGLTISADNFTAGHPDSAIIFDSNNHTTKTDTDLQFPWTDGNLKGNNGVKRLLIIAENVTDKNKDGLVDDPDDEGGRPAGLLKFKFKTPQVAFGMNLIDIDGATEYGADRGYVSFRSAGVEKARVGWGAFVDPASPFFDPSVKYGNRTANHIQPINVGQLRITSFDEVYVDMGWSSGIDNIFFDDDISLITPEPASMALVLPALFALRRRNRN